MRLRPNGEGSVSPEGDDLAGLDPTLEDDPALIYRHTNRRWRLHIFVGAAEGPVKINWEHTEFQWVGLEDLDEYEYVPGVKAALVAVL